MGARKDAYRVLEAKPKKIYRIKDLGVNEIIILKRNLKK
jgi:hypothetical protein